MWKSNNLKSLKGRQQMDINRRATIGEGHICLQGKNLSFNKYMIFYIHDKQSINQWYEI
jgi:hypothetical protein